MSIKFKYIIILLAFAAVSCGPKKGIVTKKKNSPEKEVITEIKDIERPRNEDIKERPEEVKEVVSDTRSSVDIYIDLYSEIAKAKMRSHKIPASITLAQGILESGVGRQRLAVEANNHFGIKCHKEWKGNHTFHDDDEKGECFRKYHNAKYSFRDHSLFLTMRTRYAKLFTLKKGDYNFAKADGEILYKKKIFFKTFYNYVFW
jgi:flagellum-specific peptidoglycan hydrolase FlgJ